jgi:hypothetical protein
MEKPHVTARPAFDGLLLASSFQSLSRTLQEGELLRGKHDLQAMNMDA